MRRIALTATLLALSACTAPELDQPSRDTRHTLALHGGINDQMQARLVASPGAATVRLPRAGGYIRSAMAIAMAGNMRGDCFVIGDEVLQSAGVIIARQANCFARPDPHARVFGIHMPHIGGVVDHASARHYFGPAGIDAPGCAEWYARQPEAEGNRIAFVSWEMLERECA